ncbi:MAG: hypothetical protein M0R06_23415 [Sphaerochaeta sp.]|jgi:hypothetical protein|nr:hypothetical protein [Sphaerochaeta sp.]
MSLTSRERQVEELAIDVRTLENVADTVLWDFLGGGNLEDYCAQAGAIRRSLGYLAEQSECLEVIQSRIEANLSGADREGDYRSMNRLAILRTRANIVGETLPRLRSLALDFAESWGMDSSVTRFP